MVSAIKKAIEKLVQAVGISGEQKPIGATALEAFDALMRDSDAVASASWHPFGFLKIAFDAGTIGAELRIHIWHPSYGRRQHVSSICHEHNWRLVSHVIVGSIEDRQYMVEEQGCNLEYRLYQVQYRAGVSVSIATDRLVSCRLARTRAIAAGERYAIETGVFHTTVVADGELAATIVLASDFEDRRPFNVRQRDGEREYVYIREQPARHDLQSVLAGVVRALRTDN